jgi:hypothetical protein
MTDCRVGERLSEDARLEVSIAFKEGKAAGGGDSARLQRDGTSPRARGIGRAYRASLPKVFRTRHLVQSVELQNETDSVGPQGVHLKRLEKTFRARDQSCAGSTIARRPRTQDQGLRAEGDPLASKEGTVAAANACVGNRERGLGHVVAFTCSGRVGTLSCVWCPRIRLRMVSPNQTSGPTAPRFKRRARWRAWPTRSRVP